MVMFGRYFSQYSLSIKHETLFSVTVMRRFDRAIALSIVLMPMARSSQPMTVLIIALQRFWG